MSAVSASPGITRMRPNTISEESSEHGDGQEHPPEDVLVHRPPPAPAYLSIQARASVGDP